ncbi:MAG TPA: hypothetical protein VGF26_28500, partial [Ramlibacter sp.]
MLSRTDLPPQRQAQPAAAADSAVPNDPIAHLEETLQQSEEHLQLALEAGAMGIWQVDLLSGTSVWWPGMESLHGLAPGAPALDPEAYFERVHPEDRERVRAVVQDSIARTG